MATIIVTQDEIRNGIELLAVHDPLYYIVEVVYDTVIDGSITTKVVKVGPDQDEFTPILLSSNTVGTTVTEEYMFDAYNILSALMPDPLDVSIVTAGSNPMDPTTLYDTIDIAFEFTFSVSGLDLVEVETLLIHAANQIGVKYGAGASLVGAGMYQLWNGIARTFYLPYDRISAFYFYLNAIPANSIDILITYDDATTTLYNTPARDGYFKVANLFKQGARVKIYDSVTFALLHEDLTIELLPECNDLNVKWISKEGYYKYFSFYKDHIETQAPKKIGEKKIYNTTFYGAQSEISPTGFDNQKTIRANTGVLELEQVKYLADIADSPYVYLYDGPPERGDDEKWWIQCEVTDTFVDQPGRNAKNVTVTIARQPEKTIMV